MSEIDTPIDFSIKNQSKESKSNPTLIGLLSKMINSETAKRKSDDQTDDSTENNSKRRRKASNDEAIDLSFKATDSLEGSETSDSGNHSNMASGDEGKGPTEA